MKRVYIIIYAVLLILPMMAGAQTLTNSERRHINSKVLTLIEDYERIATLYDEEAEYFFETLFERGPESMVFCDMIGSEPYLQTIPVSEYIRQLRSYASTVTTVIKDVKKGTMSYRNGRWHIPVNMKKSFTYIDKDGYTFSVEDYHNSDIDIRMNLIYDPVSDVCVIESIDGDLQSDKKFPEGRFFIVSRSNDMSSRYLKHFSSLKVGDNGVEFNEFGQAVLPSGEGHVDDIDIEVRTDTLSKGFNYDVVSFDFKARKSRLKLRYGYSPNAFKVNNVPDVLDVKAPAMEFGVDFGVASSLGRNAKLGIYTGAGLMLSSLNMTQNTNVRYTYSTVRLNEKDMLWEPVNVTYDIESANQKVSYMDLFVPLYFEVEHRIGNYLMISWSLGAKGYYNLNVNASDLNINFKSSESQSLQTMNKSFGSGFYKCSPFDASAFANLGLDVNILKKRIYFMVRAGYEYGLMTTYKSDLAPYFKSGSGSSYPVIYDAANNQHVMVHPMVNGLEFSRRGFWISGGIKFKL